jgi:hypothetical protein
VLHALPIDCHTQALEQGRHRTRPDLALLTLDFEFGVLASAFEGAFNKSQFIGSVLVSSSVSPRLFVVGIWRTYEDDKCEYFKMKRG